MRFGGSCAKDANVKSIARFVVSASETPTTTALLSPALASPAVASPVVGSLLRRWWPVAAVAGAGLLVGDGLIHLGGVIFQG